MREKSQRLSARIDYNSMMIHHGLNSLVQDFTRQRGRYSIRIRGESGRRGAVLATFARGCRTSSSRHHPAQVKIGIEFKGRPLRGRQWDELKSGNNDGMLVETHIRYLENLKNGG